MENAQAENIQSKTEINLSKKYPAIVVVKGLGKPALKSWPRPKGP